jgi:hypothetical protein
MAQKGRNPRRITMEITVVRGGSGRWVAFADKRCRQPFASGHVPKAADFEGVCKRQIIRFLDVFAAGKPVDVAGGPRGGSLYDVDIDDSYATIVAELVGVNQERRVRGDGVAIIQGKTLEEIMAMPRWW